MRLRTLFRTSVFQLTLVYMALFALSAVALLAFIYWSTFGYIERQTNAVIEAEINGLREQFQPGNLGGLADIINERVRGGADERSVYLLADGIGRRYAGNLSSWPKEIDRASGEWADVPSRRGVSWP